jgi:hypothetical protein
MQRDEAASFIDAMPSVEFADTLKAMSAAGFAVDGATGGNLFYESAARRIAAADKIICDLERRVTQLESLPRRGLTMDEIAAAQGFKIHRPSSAEVAAQVIDAAARSRETESRCGGEGRHVVLTGNYACNCGEMVSTGATE